MATTSTSTPTPDLSFQLVDDFYFSALYDHDQIFPISDEQYAEELQLQEALISSSSSSPSPSPSETPLMATSDSEPGQSSNIFCDICMDTKTPSEMFSNTNVCTHLFCTDCISSHIASKLQENIAMVQCPDPKCNRVIGPELCRSFVPKEVAERWEDVLCESLLLGCQKIYCPFKDCSTMLLVDDGGEPVTESECPNCNRLFCAQCQVGWHAGLTCIEFQKGERAEDLMLMELAKNQKWRRCPNCKFYVEKVDGCLHISCRCGYHFCYGCGKEHSGTHMCAST